MPCRIHAVDPGSTPTTLYSLHSPSVVIPEHGQVWPPNKQTKKEEAEWRRYPLAMKSSGAGEEAGRHGQDPLAS